MDSKTLLGKKSYPSIVDEIHKKIQQAQADTLTGTNLLKETYVKLNESKTPMMDVKEFITKAEQVAPDDATLSEVIDFCKKKATTGDLNYIINLCKEEHFKNLSRAGHPSPEDTLKEIENEFNEPGSVIEQGIKNGIFDRLNSKLLNNVKLSLGVKVRGEEEIRKELNESFQYELGGICKYCPIGVSFEDIKNNRLVVLTESDVLSYDSKKQEFAKITDVEIPVNYKRLMEAINSLNYDPETELFNLSEGWDFNLSCNSNGECFVGKDKNSMKQIPKDKVKSLLLESVNSYMLNPTLAKNFNKDKFLYDGNNFIMLLENINEIYKVDKLHVLRNLDEDTYCMFDMHDVHGTDNPKILSVNGKESKQFGSFMNLCESVQETIGYDCKKLFEKEIRSENEQLNHRREKLNSLMEEQKSLNENINKVQNLKKFAEHESPAMDKLNEQEEILRKRLDANIEEMNHYQNEFELH